MNIRRDQINQIFGRLHTRRYFRFLPCATTTTTKSNDDFFFSYFRWTHSVDERIMIKNGWDEKEAQQQPVAATQLFMHLLLSLLSFIFQFLCVVFYIFGQRAMDQNAWALFLSFSAQTNSCDAHIKVEKILRFGFSYLLTRPLGNLRIEINRTLKTFVNTVKFR